MTTATAPRRVPREALVRESFRAEWRASGGMDDALGGLARAVDAVFDLEDLRESEMTALDAMLDRASLALEPEYDAMAARYRDALEEVAVGFAREHPNAPLRQPEVPA